MYAGAYALRPSYGETQVVLYGDGTASVRAPKGEWRGAYQVTSEALRIFVTPEAKGPSRIAPIGVFLRADYDPGGWRGIWDGDVSFLVRGGTGIPQASPSERKAEPEPARSKESKEPRP